MTREKEARIFRAFVPTIAVAALTPYVVTWLGFGVRGSGIIGLGLAALTFWFTYTRWR